MDWRTYAPEAKLIEALLQAHVMVVTQKDSVKGLLWPSKLNLVMSLPRPILFVGPVTGSIAAELTQECSAGVFAPDGSGQALADYLIHLYETWPPLDQPQLRATFTRAEADSLWLDLITRLSQSKPTTNSYDAGHVGSQPP